MIQVIQYGRKEEGKAKKSWRRSICMGLCVFTVLNLVGCEKEKSVESATSGWGKDNTALAKEFVYTEQMLKLPETLGNASVQQVTQTDANIYALWEVYGNEEMPESKFKLMSMTEEGNEIEFQDVQICVESEAYDTDVYTDFTHFAFSGDRLFGIKEYYEVTEPEQAVDVDATATTLCCWDFDGTMVWEKNLELDGTEGGNEKAWKLLPDSDGGTCIVLGGNDAETLIFTAEGVLEERITLAAIDRTLSAPDDIFAGKDGRLFYIYIDEKKESTMWLNELDLSQKAIGEAKQLPDSLRAQGYMAIVDGNEQNEVVYTTDTGVYAVAKEEMAEVQWMSFINSDVPTTNMNHIILLDEMQFIGIYFDDYTHIQQISIFTQISPEEIADKEVLVLAGYYVPDEVKNRVVEFNRTSLEYKIVIKEYEMYDTAGDGMSGYTRLNMDIVENGLPDILIADSYLPVADYISKGLLADIDELIAADKELSKTEFMENIFDAYRVNGKLYYVSPSFSVKTLVGKTSLLGEKSSWTMQEMTERMASIPECTQLIEELTRSKFIQMMISYCGNDFVDAETGKCNFTSEDFVAMLEYAKMLPEEIDWSEYGDEYWIKQDFQYRENRTLLAECEVSNVRYINDYINGYFGEEISYVGFPSDIGSGAVVEAGEQYLISAKSENIKGAWEFVRYYLTEDYQRKLLMFPVNKDIFMEKAMEATENPYTLDRNGNKTEYEYKISIGDESIIAPNLTKEQVDKFVDFVSKIDKCAYYDENIEDIINEEVTLFLTEQKSAAEVAEIIQSRVEVYVNEKRM